MNNRMNKMFSFVLSLALSISILAGCSSGNSDTSSYSTTDKSSAATTENTTIVESSINKELKSSPVSLSDIPEFTNKPYVEINNNEPEFKSNELTTESYEYYSDLDLLGRCGVTYACLGKDIMPTEKRGEIGSVKPTGWQTVKYDNVDGKYLYNRCHLIGYQLSGENANVKNLITGTRYLNTKGMLPFENLTADYIKETNNHVMYRVTPIFDGDNLVASGVQMEGYSVEDNGDGVCFNVYCYNNQPDIEIDYATGKSYAMTTIESDDTSSSSKSESSKSKEVSEQKSNQAADTNTYVLNTNSKKFHYPTCSSVNKIKDSNRDDFSGSRDELISQGYEPCKNCNP